MPNMRGSAKSLAYEDLKRAILTLDRVPGSSLEEGELCDRYGLSRTPLREVLQRLAGTGYVVQTENRGAKVASMDLAAMREQYGLAGLDEALLNITRFIVKLAPLGIFAITANAAGTLDLAALDRLQVYVASYLLLWAIFFFFLLPGLLIAFTPIKYRELFREFRVVFITAFPEKLLTGERPEPAFLIAKPYTEEQVRSAVSQSEAIL